MIPLELTLRYASAADLAAHLAEQPGALLLRIANAQDLVAYTQLLLYIRLPDDGCDTAAELLQALPNLGLVVRLSDPDAVASLLTDASVTSPATLPVISGGRPPEELAEEQAGDAEGDGGEPDPDDDGSDEDGEGSDDDGGRRRVVGAALPAGSTVLSWPIEKLQSEWHTLTTPEKIRVAKHGKRPARSMVLRGGDKNLQAFLLLNPKIGIDEIAVMAGQASLDPALLRRIAMSPDWVRNTNVARALVTNPKLSTPLVQKVLPHLSVDEVRRLTKSGKVRASLKRLLMKRIEGGR